MRSSQPSFSAHYHRSSGAALIIVLAFVVLLTGLVVAFFSRSLTERQISNASANIVRVEQLGSGALDTIIADLQQEIAAGSSGTTTIISGSISKTLYIPKSSQTFVPAMAGKNAAGTMPANLIKRSAYGQPFFPTTGTAYNLTNFPPSSRAAGVSSTSMSINFRTVSLPRWNAPFLLPKASPISDSDFTPVTTGSDQFVAPDWVIVRRSGSNYPLNSWDASLTVTGAAPAVGRYAYAVYDEGGLLDMNAAGFPVNSTASTFLSGTINMGPYKPALAYADLTQLPGIGASPALTGVVQAKLINAVTGWRNFASAVNYPPPGTSAALTQIGSFPTYAWNVSNSDSLSRFLLSNTTAGFMRVSGSLAISGSTAGSDRLFTSRQELIKMLLQGVATTTTERAGLQLALQYMGTFSRDINQPTLMREYLDTNSIYYWPQLQNEAYSSAWSGGGNNQVSSNYSLLNPSFPGLRILSPYTAASYTVSFTTVSGPNGGSVTLNTTPVVNGTAARYSDGQPPVIGDPLVKYRFPLNKIAWLTFRGPIASGTGNSAILNPTSDSDVAKIIGKLHDDGFLDDFLKQGTAQNIFYSFGLVWDSALQRWNYRNNPNSRANVTTNPTIATLDVTDNAGAISGAVTSKREPDFFELLKSSLMAGALGKAATRQGGITKIFPNAGLHPYELQHAVDVRVDQQVMQIGANIIDQFDYDGYPTRIAANYGNPGSNEVRGVENNPYLYRVRTGVVVVRNPNPLAVAENSHPTGITVGPPGIATTFDAGVGLVMHIPEVWNPHSEIAPLGDPRPTEYRIVADSAQPDDIFDLQHPKTIRRDTMTKSNYNNGTYGYRDFRAFTRVISGAAQLASYSANVSWKFTTGPKGLGTDVGYKNGTTGLPPNIPQRAIVSGNFTDPGVISTGATGPSNPNGGFYFTVPNVTGTGTPKTGDSHLFREPTLLALPGYPKAGSGGNIDQDSNFKGPDYSADPYFGTGSGAFKDSTGGSIFQNGGFKSEAEYPLFPLTTVARGQSLTGVVLGFFPLRFVSGSGTNASSVVIYNGRGVLLDAGNVATTAQKDKTEDQYDSEGCPTPWLDYRVQYKDAKAAGGWATYDEKYTEVVYDFVGAPVTDDTASGQYKNSYPFGGFIQGKGSNMTTLKAATNDSYRSSNCSAWQAWVDPRTSRFGAITASHGGPYPPGGFSATTADWNSSNNMMLKTMRPDVVPGYAQSSNRDTSSSTRYPSDYYKFFMNAGLNMDKDNFWMGMFSQNRAGNSTNTYFADPDGVVRRAMGGYVGLTGTTAVSNIGLPMYNLTNNNQSLSRAYILNRPFHSVGELGYVFSDIPWRNLDMNTPESGYSALLDVFCIQDSAASPLVAGKVNLNTRQAPVIQAILAGGYRDEQVYQRARAQTGASSSDVPVLSGSDAQSLASSIKGASVGLVRITGASPLTNVSQLVGNWKPGSSINLPIDGSAAFTGFSANVGNLFSTGTAESANVERVRESAVRTLAQVGSTRVWNLMIDLVAQSGRYPTSATGLDKFVVEGEQRYWLHIAIDRLTGEVLDKRVEVVKE